MTNKYLFDAATLIKMTTHFENMLEHKRIRINNMILFHSAAVYRYLSDQGGITKQKLQELALKNMKQITDEEVQYIMQLYSSNGQYISFDDLLSMIAPRTILPSTPNLKEDPTETILFECVEEFWKLLFIETQFFRQAEPLRFQMIVKHHEDGERLCDILRGQDKTIKPKAVLKFMHQQRFHFLNQDVNSLIRRISPFQKDVEHIEYDDFFKHSPLIPFKLLCARDTRYKFVQVSPDLIPNPEASMKNQIEISPPKRELQSGYFYSSNRNFFYPEGEGVQVAIKKKPQQFTYLEVPQNKLHTHSQQIETTTFYPVNIDTDGQNSRRHEHYDHDTHQPTFSPRDQTSHLHLPLQSLGPPSPTNKHLPPILQIAQQHLSPQSIHRGSVNHPQAGGRTSPLQLNVQSSNHLGTNPNLARGGSPSHRGQTSINYKHNVPLTPQHSKHIGQIQTTHHVTQQSQLNSQQTIIITSAKNIDTSYRGNTSPGHGSRHHHVDESVRLEPLYNQSPQFPPQLDGFDQDDNIQESDQGNKTSQPSRQNFTISRNSFVSQHVNHQQIDKISYENQQVKSQTQGSHKSSNKPRIFDKNLIVKGRNITTSVHH